MHFTFKFIVVVVPYVLIKYSWKIYGCEESIFTSPVFILNSDLVSIITLFFERVIAVLSYDRSRKNTYTSLKITQSYIVANQIS